MRQVHPGGNLCISADCIYFRCNSMLHLLWITLLFSPLLFSLQKQCNLFMDLAPRQKEYHPVSWAPLSLLTVKTPWKVCVTAALVKPLSETRGIHPRGRFIEPLTLHVWHWNSFHHHHPTPHNPMPSYHSPLGNISGPVGSDLIPQNQQKLLTVQLWRIHAVLDSSWV